VPHAGSAHPDTTYQDSIGQPLRAGGGDRVFVDGDGPFEVVSIRPERVAVIRNRARGRRTSSVPLTRLTPVPVRSRVPPACRRMRPDRAEGAPVTATTSRVMRIATGETRPITRVWPDGAYTCPWCGAANNAAAQQCRNPACWASPWATADGVRAEQERRARIDGEAAERRRAATAAAEAAERTREADRLLWQRRLDEARTRGACIDCLRASHWRVEPRFVRHRRPDFHRRDAQ
jgi:hypothetical protein